MKMGVGTRILFSVFMLIIIAICAIIILSAFGVFSEYQVDCLYAGFKANYKYVWAGICAVLLIVAVCLLFFGTKKREPDTVILSTSMNGNIEITLAALTELTHRYLNEIYGIVPQKVSIHTVAEKNVTIKLSFSVKPEGNIPEITEAITQGLQKYIEQYSGIYARTISITVLPLKLPLHPAN